MPCEHEHHVAYGDCGCIAGWKEDIEDLVSQDHGILVDLDHFTEKHVFLLLLTDVAVHVGLLKQSLVLKCCSDVLVHEVVDFGVCLYPGFVEVIERFEWPCPPGDENIR